jgi:hypothetical protein
MEVMDTIEVKELESRRELERCLDAHEGTTVLLGTDAESPRRFYAMIPGGRDIPLVGIIASGHGVKPGMARLANGTTILVGHDCKVTALDSKSGQVMFVLPLNGVFYEFIDYEEDSEIVIHELGALKIDAGANRHWSLDTDVVEDFEVTKDGRLKLRTMDNAYTVVDIRSGEKQ